MTCPNLVSWPSRATDFRPFRASLAAGFAALLLLGGCAEPTPYAPRVRGTATGYTDRQLAENRFRVTFTGNTVTSRETVENYLLLRAAEVTLAAGRDFFVFDTRNTRARTRYSAVPEGPVGPYGYYGLGRAYWRSYWGVGFGFEPDVDIVTRTNYEAYAEIVLLTPEQARDEPRAIEARDVIRHLAPTAAPPPPR